MKTLKKWEDSDLSLLDYLKPLDQVDEALYLYAGEIVSPQYLTDRFTQMGEAEYHIDHVPHYATFLQMNQKFYYLGVLPEFIQ